MLGLRIFLVLFLLFLLAYTGIVVSDQGLGLIPIFFGDIAALTWPGQFNLDFLGFLLLSGLWVLWRNGFSALSFPLALFAALGGMVFLSIYLLFLLSRARGDFVHVLLGVHSPPGHQVQR